MFQTTNQHRYQEIHSTSTDSDSGFRFSGGPRAVFNHGRWIPIIVGFRLFFYRDVTHVIHGELQQALGNSNAMTFRTNMNQYYAHSFLSSSVQSLNPAVLQLQQNPVVPPTLLSLPSPHGTPPTKGPEKSHQVLPPL